MGNSDKIKIFLSRPNPFTENQDFFINEIVSLLKRHNFECITLQAAEYTPYEVMVSLREMIQRSYGMVILAVGQTYISEGIRKKDAEDNPRFFESKVIHLENKWITSVYCQIEGILALTFDLPILTIPQEKLTREGILHQGEYSITSPEFTLDSKEKILQFVESSEFRKSFDKWKQMVIEKYEFIKGGELGYK